MSTCQNSLTAHAVPIATPNRFVDSALWSWVRATITGLGVPAASGSHAWSAFDARIPTASRLEHDPAGREAL